MKRTLFVAKSSTGQFLYKIEDERGVIWVGWQWGSHDRRDTIAQARHRFSFDEIKEEKNPSY